MYQEGPVMKKYFYFFICFFALTFFTDGYAFQSKYTFEYKWESFEKDNLWLIDNIKDNNIEDISIIKGRSTHRGNSLKVKFIKKGTGIISRVDVKSFGNVNALRLDVYAEESGTRLALAFSTSEKFIYSESKSIILEKGWNMNVTISLDKNTWKKDDESTYDKYPEKLDELKKLMLKFETPNSGSLYLDNIRVVGKKIINNANEIPYDEITKKNTVNKYELLDKMTIPATSEKYSVSIRKSGSKKYILKYKDINSREKASFQINRNLNIADIEKIIIKIAGPQKAPVSFAMSFQTGNGWIWYESPMFYLHKKKEKSIQVNLNAGYFKSQQKQWGYHSYLKDKDNVHSITLMVFGMGDSDFTDEIKILSFNFIRGTPFSAPVSAVDPQYIEKIKAEDYTQPEISKVEHFSESVEIFDKFEIDFHLFKTYKNPYNPEEIYCEAVFISPDGRMHKVPAFYYEQFTKNLQSSEQKNWKVRFAPEQTGKWSFYLTAKNPAGDVFYKRDHFEFNVTPSESHKGFIKTKGKKFIFSNKEVYYPQGLNLCWIDRYDKQGRENLAYAGQVYLDYLKNFSRSDMNWARIWNTPWGLILEWIKPVAEGLGKYSQENAFLFDQIIEYARENGIYFQYVINFHRMFDENYEWEVNPYNIKNGGPLKTPQDFFTDKNAKKYLKRRLLYTIARWGYSSSIMSWELFNEADLTSNFNPDNVRDWHVEMANYMKSVDTHDHLVTTSFSRPLSGMETFQLQEIDYSQTHTYTYDFKTALFTIPSYKIDQLNKPHVTGEIGGAIELAEEEVKDKMGIRLHQVLWYSFFSQASSSGMYWWWDEYVNKNNLYSVFENYNKLVNGFNFAEGKRIKIKVSSGGIGDYFFAPILDWEKPTGEKFKLIGDELKGKGYLSKYLHGKFQNDSKSSPEFDITFLKNGYVEIMVGQASPYNSNLTVIIDGKEVIREDFPRINSSVPKQMDRLFIKEVSKGPHTIRIENNGNDWLMINYIKFINCIDDIEAYGVQDDSQIYIWIKNRKFNAENWLEGLKSEAEKGKIAVDDVFKYDKVKVFYYDTWKNEMIKVDNYSSKNKKFIIDYPRISKDILLVIKKLN